ncbi:zinc ABC transporter substrate-binding protein [Thiohalocapsa halophila]|uniref:Zinc ABC transporter substrate-binding protein n=1 Tax=Thiohalocapsa halophila TaxID=69359 RepID=A0ABS1CKN3_9GAMM|nr:metal ABC transporter substrate-binding protein [Thiohalocapsa halophila]MBK1632399.1 zinc ABC transporter substrate-binding protein [Thiohalocapsa halophila]
MRRLLTGLWAGLALLAAPVLALDVVATSPSMGALVRAVAPQAQLTVLAGPDRDLHALQAKPSMIRALRSADLLVAVGAELEMGWLPAASSSAANPDILPGREGYFEAAAQVPLLDVGGPADRAMGDVHPAGNPHVDLDPVRMAQVAEALGARMARLHPGNAASYRANARRFAKAVEQRLPQWQAELADAPGAVLYHRDAIYLLERFEVPLLGTIEPVPGVPPSGRDLRALAGKLRGGEGIIIHAPYQSPKGPRKLGRELGWPVETLPLSPPVSADGDGYLRHIDRWVSAVASA